MNPEQILKEVNDIFIDVLDNEAIILTSETSSNDIDEWDSLNHTQLVVAIEKHFKQRFTTSEVQNWKNVREICESIIKRINK
jgi:acyl carrier protein